MCANIEANQNYKNAFWKLTIYHYHKWCTINTSFPGQY